MSFGDKKCHVELLLVLLLSFVAVVDGDDAWQLIGRMVVDASVNRRQRWGMVMVGDDEDLIVILVASLMTERLFLRRFILLFYILNLDRSFVSKQVI